jgi:hypothetical protein
MRETGSLVSRGMTLIVAERARALIIGLRYGRPDKSVDVYFGPKAPTGKENNWVQTIPGKGWNVLLRLYGPLEPWFDKTWRPGEFELVP